MTRVNAAAQAFREPSIITNILDSEDFDDIDARRLRYAMNWASYEGMAYRNMHLWVTRMKVEFGLYRYTRDIRSPGGILGDFWQTHLMGGLLDPAAGDGDEVPSALPIILPDDKPNEALRPAISKVWQWSNWQGRKASYTLTGATMGDTALRIVDNVDKQKVYIQVISPANIKEIIKDDFGFVKAYCLEEQRADPRGNNRAPVTYSETATHIPDSNDIVFQTFLNGSPYPWQERDGVPIDTWKEPYGFIPFVHVPHIDVVGSIWGWAEMHKGRSKFFEVDDIASKLDDQIRKIVDAAWFVAGLKTGDKIISGKESSRDKPQPGREEMPIFGTSDPNAKITAMVADLDLAGVNETLRDLDKTIEKLYPELQLEAAIGANVSGATLRELRRKSTAKVQERRVAYDNGLVQAQMMAVTIGGFRGYGTDEGSPFKAFNLDSFTKGDLKHTIGARPVFALDELDRLEESRILWETAARAVEKTGVSIEAFLEAQGWPEAKINKLTRANRRAAGNAARAIENVPDSDEEAF